MSLMQKAANAISKAAGWRVAVPDAGGVVRFALKDGLDMELFSPDGRTAVFRSEIRPLPEDASASAELLQKAGQLAVGVMKSRGSIVSLAEQSLWLHVSLSLDCPSDSFVETAKQFLNDLDWWRTQLADTRVAAPVSPFNMASSGFGRL